MGTDRISLVITTYNRTDLLFESFAQVLDDPRITDVCIVDDHSSTHTIIEINRMLSELPAHREKIRFFMNDRNLGCYRNKREAVSKASNEWVILLDSDNVITPVYIDALFTHEWSRRRILQPEFAEPHFDFTQFSGKYFGTPFDTVNFNDTFFTMLNACNYFVNRDEYLKVWEDRPEPWTADSLLQNYNWLNAGNYIHVLPGLRYQHRVHDGSHYKEHHKKTGNLYNELVNKLKAMR